MKQALMTPAEFNIQQEIKKKQKQSNLDSAAHALAEHILKEAMDVGYDRVYLYNPFFPKGKQIYPACRVQRATQLLNESGHWCARAVYVRWWHSLLLINTNHRFHRGTPVWRIHLAPIGCKTAKAVFLPRCPGSQRR